MSDRSGALEWARTADLTKPLRWGAVESEILGRDPAPEARVELKFIVLTWVGRVALVMAILMTLSPLVIVGSLAVTLSDPDVDATGALMRPAIFFSALECFFLISLLWAWWSTRRDQSLVFVLFGAYGALASAVTLFVMSPSQVGLVITSLVIGALVLGLVVVLVIGLLSRRSKNPRVRKPPRRGPRSAVLEMRYWETRKLVLEILRRRGLVDLDENDRANLVQMPLGYWEEIDDVDERERRRILGARFMGWRDFHTSDRRPWPPPPRAT